MKRLTFLAPDMKRAQAVVNDFREMGISDEMMHVIAEDHEMLQKSHIHEATEMETSELESNFDWGMVAGGVLGLVIGFFLYEETLFGYQVGAEALLILPLLGIFLGGWIGKVIGEKTPNSRLEKYQHAIQAGQLLVMVDVPLERVPEFFKVIKKHCPKALIESTHIFHDHPLAA